MNSKEFKRVPGAFKNAVKEYDGALIAMEELKIYIPSHYSKMNLVNLGGNIAIVGQYCIVNSKKEYAVSNALALLSTDPFSVGTVLFEDEVEYLEFVYQKGDKIVTTLDVLQSDQVVYNVYNDVVSKGKTPWYMSYEDVSDLFNTALEHCGLDLRTDRAIFEMLTAIRARWPSKRTEHFRHYYKPGDNIKPAMIGLKNVIYGATNTTAKFLGSYHNDATPSALVNPSDRMEKIEELLR